MKRFLAFLLFTTAPAMAQAPRAEPVEVNPAMEYDAGNDFFQRGKNLHDSAQAMESGAKRQSLFDGAAKILTNYLAEYPNHANAERAWWYLGNSYFQAGKADDGRRSFGTLLNRYREGKWVAAASYTLAADHYNLGRYAMAAPLFERYARNIEKDEEKVRGLYFAGNCYRLLGRDHQALEAFQKVVADPAGADFVAQSELAIGHVTVKIGRLQDAHDRFVAISKKPYPDAIHGEALLHAALTARKLDQHETAQGNLESILNADSLKAFWPDAQMALMATYFDRQKYAEVIKLYENGKVANAGKREPSRLMIVGRAHMRLKQHKEALALFRQVERLVNPDKEVAFKASYYRLLCFFQLKGSHVPDQVDAFLQLYRKSRPLDYRIHTALMMKAETLHVAGRVAEAAQAYNEVEVSCVSEQNRPGLYYQRGWCLAEAGDQLGAIRSFSQFIRHYPDDSRVPSALAKRAKVYVDSGKIPKAIADFDRLVSLGKPPELVSYAWLESARLRRSENRIEDMIARYRGLLRDVDSLNGNLKAEANYWIGWGLVKTNQANKSPAHLEEARRLRPDLYQKHAGILLALGYFATQDADRLADEVNLSINGGYQNELPNQALQWSGMQSYNGGNYSQAATFLALIAKHEEPRETPKEVWRYLAKSQLEIGDAEQALESVKHVLEVEENLAWQADGLLDQGRALYALEQNEASRQAVDQALALQPQGRTRGNLRILSGDLEMRSGDPKKASAQYLIVVSFLDDDLLKPIALSKLVKAFEAQDDPIAAEKYRKLLAGEFPDWKAP